MDMQNRVMDRLKQQRNILASSLLQVETWQTSSQESFTICPFNCPLLYLEELMCLHYVLADSRSIYTRAYNSCLPSLPSISLSQTHTHTISEAFIFFGYSNSFQKEKKKRLIPLDLSWPRSNSFSRVFFFLHQFILMSLFAQMEGS